ncbi:LacI family DNA-binding transcriptional regulator [Levilactobacillus enshiensis]|uniref:LacI family DNA-binding transcriptional regulator n=1 Tax=Levilactobacillus enshiensis TaxID=2590213 RepID=UPI001CDD77CD|nr:LacI family DNA-binding transcriptional regulator [Levilactobacillus enshiensis]
MRESEVMKNKPTTIKDVAKIAGVSIATVSRYLNGHYGKMSATTRQTIERVIRENNYHVNTQAKSLIQKRTFIIGMVVADIENIFSSILFKGADTILENENYQILLTNSDNSLERERTEIERLLGLQVDGIILQPMSQSAADYQFLKDSNTPTIIVDRKIQPQVWTEVTTDNYAYSKMISEYISRLGYQRLAVVSEAIDGNSARYERYQAVKETCQKKSLDLKLITVDKQTTNAQIYAEIMRASDDLDVKTAFYVLKGTLLMQVVRTLSQYHITYPDQVGLAAFDDWDWSTLVQPQITTIQQNPQELGKRAAKALLALLADTSLPSDSLTVPSDFQVKQSLVN